jgi:hypothetical protein
MTSNAYCSIFYYSQLLARTVPDLIMANNNFTVLFLFLNNNHKNIIIHMLF